MARLLIVEDQVEVGDVLAESLLSDGFDVVVVKTAAEARAALDAEKFDLMVADMVLPGRRDGGLAEAAIAKGAQVILMSGHPDHIEEAHEAFAFLAKPFSLGAFLDVVQRALGRSSAEVGAEAQSGLRHRNDGE
jgi:DNA-binding NtrC family response regulator